MTIRQITAILGNMDQPKTIPPQTVDFKRTLITGDGTRMDALFYKQQPHKIWNDDIFIWIDGKVQVDSPKFIEHCIASLGDGDLAIMKHKDRSCVYEEYDYIISELKKGNEYLSARYSVEKMEDEKARFKAVGYPEKNGLHDCCVIVVRNTLRIEKLLNTWNYDTGLGFFDQTTIHYCSWHFGIPIQPIIFPPGYMHLVKHLKVK